MPALRWVDFAEVAKKQEQPSSALRALMLVASFAVGMTLGEVALATGLL